MLKVVFGDLFEGVQTPSLGVGGAKCSYLQISHPHQIVRRSREGENPSTRHTPRYLVLRWPATVLSHPKNSSTNLRFLLANWITGVPGSAGIDSAAARTVGVLRHMRRGALLPRLPHEIFGVVGLVPGPGEKRSNQAHQSITDPEARLARKANGQEAKLAFCGNVMTENRNGLVETEV